uniref:SR-related CTD associated factor 8 n=1 Tax=Oryzias sinensis TaxID=183150 RepID=A0A8C7WQF5_9TELE
MEAVKAFNNELYSLNEYRPPISKAKMTQITKSGIKAIKFYKHVVQSVEKFIQKCKPEYKVPGLYVIDSIVRQSRHQFGTEKDVFAPRFSKNIILTFQHLYRCPSDDKSKIVRVLNLWQKNAVFKSDIIQPLLDMAAGIPPPSTTPVLPSSAAPVNNTTPGTPATPATPANIVQGLPDWASQITNTDTVAAVAQILQSPQGQQLQQLVQSLQMQHQKPQPSLLQALDAGLVVQLQALTAQLTAAATANSLNPLEQRVSSFNKKLLGPFDFGNDSERSEESKKETSSSQMPMVSEPINSSLFHQLAEQLQQQNLEQFQKQLLEHHAFILHLSGIFRVCQIFKHHVPRTFNKASCRSPKRRRSRSRSGSRKRKHRKRSRSRSRDRKRKSSRSYSSERRAREREKERQKKGLPPIRSKTLSVCSTTLWVGQVDKKATQQDLTNLFEEFGQIESINMIPPRGCAYICMVHRQDAYRARQKLSTGSFKISSKIIKIAWALNKGVKQEYKQFWDVDLGVTYIPWEKVKVDDLDGFAEGGIIDQETVNEGKNIHVFQIYNFAEQKVIINVPSLMQLPVPQAVPSAVGLVPPSFPVNMGIPPPGYGPPPPFMRPGFNASQPPPGKQPTGLLRTPPPDHREPLGGGGQGGGGRPPLLQTPGSQLARSSLAGRLQALAGFTPDSRWNQTRGDFDERDGIQGGPQTPGGPKGFQDERSTPGQNFPNRGAVGAPPPWNRSGGPTAPFDSEHQDLDDRRRPWERQRDRDERDFDFRREMNGNRLSRERDRERDRDRDRGRERTREHERDKERDGDRERERGGWTPLLPLPTPLLPTPPINPNLTLNQGKPLTPLKINPPNMQRFQSPLVSQAQAKPPLLSLNQPPPQVQIKSLPPPAQNQAALSVPQSETPTSVETPVGQSAPVTHSPKPSSDEKDQSPLPERPPHSESSPQPETLPPSESPPHLPSKTSASPDNQTISHASPLLPLSPQDSPVTFAAADSPRERPTRFLKKQESPQNDEDSSQTQRVNGPERCSASVAEPTSNTPHVSDCLLPESERKPQQVQASPPKDPNNEQSEPLEEAPSQPVVDSVTDTEGT